MTTKKFLALCAALLIYGSTFSQSKAPVLQPCNNSEVGTEIMALSSSFQQRGFELLQFQTMMMPSGAYFPISMNMEQGRSYEINFVVPQQFHQFNVTIIDKDKKELVNKTVKSKKGGSNKFSQSFAPPYSGIFMVVLSQKIKGGGVACGGVSVLRAKNL
ncbi:MAG: hypothetical protein QM642_00200 [Edaphocola sp.]